MIVLDGLNNDNKSPEFGDNLLRDSRSLCGQLNRYSEGGCTSLMFI